MTPAFKFDVAKTVWVAGSDPIFSALCATKIPSAYRGRSRPPLDSLLDRPTVFAKSFAADRLINVLSFPQGES